jgi:hypothetical protein
LAAAAAEPIIRHMIAKGENLWAVGNPPPPKPSPIQEEGFNVTT